MTLGRLTGGVLAVALALTVSARAVPGREPTLLLAYTSGVRGEIEPCG
ncbi:MULTISPECIES: hypothetical protein [Deferrisoma]